MGFLPICDPRVNLVCADSDLIRFLNVQTDVIVYGGVPYARCAVPRDLTAPYVTVCKTQTFDGFTDSSRLAFTSLQFFAIAGGFTAVNRRIMAAGTARIRPKTWLTHASRRAMPERSPTRRRSLTSTEPS